MKIEAQADKPKLRVVAPRWIPAGDGTYRTATQAEWKELFGRRRPNRVAKDKRS